jgi:probable HAF family extracellular repeat protein
MSFAQCANNQGSVIGTSTLAGDALNHAFFWRDGVMTDLGTLGGDNSEAIWINEAGDVAGSADLAGSIIHDAVLWRHGVIHDLGTVAGDPCSRGRAINSRGQVTGGSSDCHTFQHAFVWEEGGPMLDLNMLIPPGSGLQLTNAFNINDRGEILARFVPIGAAHFDDEAFGIVLLIPCKPGEKEGCEANAGTATSMAPRTLVPTLKDSTTATWNQPRLIPSKNIAAWQLLFAQRHHIPGLGAPGD